MPKKSDIEKPAAPNNLIYWNKSQLHPAKSDTVELLSIAL